MLFAGFILLCGSPANAQTWPQQNYAAYRGMILNATNRFRDAIVRYRAPLGFDARIAQHSVVVAVAGDPECKDPTNFAYYDLNGHIVMCVESFVHFFDFHVENLKLNSVRKGWLSQSDISEYGRGVAQFYMTRQSGRDTPDGHCPAEYWVFLVRNHLPRQACFEKTVTYLPAYAEFLKSGGIYRDVFDDTLDDFRASGIDTTKIDMKKLEKYKGLTPENKLKALTSEVFNEFFLGSISAVYFHELGHFYLGHGKNGICSVTREEDAAEVFSRRLIDVFSQQGTYEDVYVGDSYYLNIYYYIYLDQLISRLDEIESAPSSSLNIADLPTELRGLGIVKLFAALQVFVDNADMKAWLSHQTGEPIDAADFKSGIDQLMALRGCNRPARSPVRQ